MLYGRRLDHALQHVDGSRYALVHAVAKRARQITLWLTADPAELRAEAAPPPAPGELTSRDPVALAVAEILEGEVNVRWDPEGRADEAELLEVDELETDPLLIEGLGDEDETGIESDDEGARMTPALAQVLEGDEAVAETAPDAEGEAVDPEAGAVAEEPVAADPLALAGEGDEIDEISLEDVDEPDEDDEEEADL